jgi:hypothetical protein
MPGGPSVLFADKVLVMEGAGDAIVAGFLDRLSAALGLTGGGSPLSFAGLGWCVFAGQGVKDGKLRDRVKLLQRLGKTVAALLDGDGPGKTAALELKDVCPTFVYTSSGEGSPVLEDALLLGLPPAEQEKALEAFYTHTSCAACSKSPRSQKCWHGNHCPPPSVRRDHKGDLQRACISRYVSSRGFPPAFRSLLSKLEIDSTGTITFLPIDAA